jgi:hypothetical protein
MTSDERQAMIRRMIDVTIHDTKVSDLKETIVELLCGGCKGFDKMTDEELETEYDDYGFED